MSVGNILCCSKLVANFYEISSSEEAHRRIGVCYYLTTSFALILLTLQQRSAVFLRFPNSNPTQ